MVVRFEPGTLSTKNEHLFATPNVKRVKRLRQTVGDLCPYKDDLHIYANWYFFQAGNLLPQAILYLFASYFTVRNRWIVWYHPCRSLGTRLYHVLRSVLGVEYGKVRIT